LVVSCFGCLFPKVSPQTRFFLFSRSSILDDTAHNLVTIIKELLALFTVYCDSAILVLLL
jgi:hypothetical protein